MAVAALKQPGLRALYSDDVEEALSSLGLLEAIEAGLVKCPVCGETIRKDSIGALVPIEGVPAVVCSRIRCMAEVLAKYS